MDYALAVEDVVSGMVTSPIAGALPGFETAFSGSTGQQLDYSASTARTVAWADKFIASGAATAPQLTAASAVRIDDARRLDKNPRSHVEQVAAKRLEVLRRTFGGEESLETLARLHMLDAQLKQLAPRVTTQQVEALEAAASLAQRVAARSAKRAQLLGLSL